MADARAGEGRDIGQHFSPVEETAPGFQEMNDDLISSALRRPNVRRLRSISAIENGLYQPATKARMTKHECERGEVTARLEEAPQRIPMSISAKARRGSRYPARLAHGSF
ncbi:MAG: hypothetical protein H2055_10150 [Sphingopyxis sp.]|nr:hypothetical protein [Sphingopyxis sp.]